MSGQEAISSVHPTHHKHTFWGIVLTIFGGLCFSIQDSGIKWVSAELAVVQILFLRSVIGIVVLTASTRLTGETIRLRVRRPGLLLFRTVVNILSWFLFFSGLQYLPLATAMALFFSFPLFLAVLSVPLLGEKVGIRRSISIIIGFVGVLFITNPAAGIEWPMLYMLGAAFGWSLVASTTRIVGQTESTSTVLFFTLFGFVLITSMPQFWIWQDINLQTTGLIVLVSVFGVVAQFCLTRAYAIATPSLIAPFEYSGLIWAAIIGYLVWGDIPGTNAIIGTGLIVFSGLYIIHREAILHRRANVTARQ